MGNLVPGQRIEYTESNGVIYANYVDCPHNKTEPWIVGATDTHPNCSKDLTYIQWCRMARFAEKNPEFAQQLEHVITVYHLLKDQ